MRAIGANVLAALAFETDYGVAPGSGFYRLPMVSEALGEEQGLIASDLIGYGRQRLDPTLDVKNNDGDIVGPVDVRAFGLILKWLMGAPTTTGAVAASGTWTFTVNPATNSTITVNGTVFTFVASGASGAQINKGATLSDTLDAAIIVLNASAVSGVAQATYSNTGTVLTATNDTLGAGGNAFTLAASSSPASNATVSGATMAGGASKHSFTSGASALPSASLEIGFTDIAQFYMNFGGLLNMLKVSMARSGLLNYTASVICQGAADPVGSTAAGSPTALTVKRFAQAIGAVNLDSAPTGSVMTAEWTYSNDMEKVEVIRSDGRIAGADPGTPMSTAQITMRFDSATDIPAPGTPVPLSFGWQISTAEKLLITMPRMFWPKVKIPAPGPKGIQLTINAEAANDVDLGYMVKVELTNDVASYA